MGKSKIEWTDRVWNPVTGCTRISEGCRHCYAERMSKRLAGRAGYPEDGFKVTLHPERLEEPLRWKKPSRIFVCSMGDLFHEDVPDEFIDRVFAVMAACPQHTFMILTKRPKRMRDYILTAMFDENCNYEGWYEALEKRGVPDAPPLENVFCGTSVENQTTADERIPFLLNIPVATLFVSYEPALAPVDFTNIIHPYFRTKHPYDPIMAYDALRGHCKASDDTGLPKLDWIIMGGESGPGARPMHPDWARSVRDQCEAAGVPFFFKQWGEWFPIETDEDDFVHFGCDAVVHLDGTFQTGKRLMVDRNKDDVLMRRTGKTRAGCLLDGKEHKEMPR